MHRYTYSELTNMHFMYEAASENGSATQRRHKGQFLGRRLSNCQIFEPIFPYPYAYSKSANFGSLQRGLIVRQ
ncbi:hypothetical protein CEXT_315831 [Caerostris extrusa]|uniref:Ycf15 n=1 Tax=Caerostris extrusa TaxID=172846 RepID=A0AAV4NMU5_CAEEX|nr:hypothetical protein CEXT_315831 [Caerostris extrusa]